MTEFSQEDINVLIDCFVERLPMVWQDAYQEVIGGKSLNEVLIEMKEGHVLRILGKLGYDVSGFIQDFTEFMNGNSH